MKHVLAVLIFLSSVACLQAQSVSRITSYDSDVDPLGYGTAFCVGTFNDISVWVTNGHVIEDGQSYTVLIDGEEYDVVLDEGRVVMDYDREVPVDLAVLFGEGIPCEAWNRWKVRSSILDPSRTLRSTSTASCVNRGGTGMVK